MITLRQAVAKELVLQIKYFPGKEGQRVGWRTVLPLDLYMHRGVEYCLCWFIRGSSVEGGGTGFRLYIVENIQDLREVDTTEQQPFAMVKDQKRGTWSKKARSWLMIMNNQIERE